MTDLSKAVQTINSRPDFITSSDRKNILRVFQKKQNNEKIKKQKRENLKKNVTLLLKNGTEFISGAFSEKDKTRFEIRHPVFGNLKNGVMSCKPLFECVRINKKEPLFSTALAWFCQNDPAVFKAVVKAICSLVFCEKKDLKDICYSLKNLTFHKSFAEERAGQNEDDLINKKTNIDGSGKKNNDKRIDNVLYWKTGKRRYCLAVEIKFNACLNNRLDLYRKKIERKYPASVVKKFIVISNKRICPDRMGEFYPKDWTDTLKKKVKDEYETHWQNILWKNLLPLIDECSKNVGNEDFKRFLASLWLKSELNI